MRNLSKEELQIINGGAEQEKTLGYKIGYYYTKAMTKVMDGIEWVNDKLGL